MIYLLVFRNVMKHLPKIGVFICNIIGGNVYVILHIRHCYVRVVVPSKGAIPSIPEQTKRREKKKDPRRNEGKRPAKRVVTRRTRKKFDESENTPSNAK